MHKKFFEKRLAKLIAKRDSLTQKALASQDIEEIRSIQAQLADINSDIEDVQEALAAYDDEPAESRANVPVNGVQHNAGITASFSQTGVERAANGSDGNILESMEYRRAFQQYFQRGIAIPEDMQKRVSAVMADMPHEMRAGDAINTGNTGAVIPVTVMREVINTVRKRYGNLYSKVTKMAVQGAVDFPIGDLDGDFSWVTEDTVSPEKSIGRVVLPLVVIPVVIKESIISTQKNYSIINSEHQIQFHSESLIITSV